MKRQDYIERFLNVSEFNFNNTTFRNLGKLRSKSPTNITHNLYTFNYENIWTIYYTECLYCKEIEDKQTKLLEIETILYYRKIQDWTVYMKEYLFNIIKNIIDKYTKYSIEIPQLIIPMIHNNEQLKILIKDEFLKMKKKDFQNLIELYNDFITKRNNSRNKLYEKEYEENSETLFQLDLLLNLD